MGRRPQRLGAAIREEVARMVTSQLKDPRLGLVTVTRVEVSPDLTRARVYAAADAPEASGEPDSLGTGGADPDEDPDE